MGDDNPNILSGGDLPFTIPPYTVGQLIFQAFRTGPPDNVIMIEAETGKSITVSEYLVLGIKVAEALKRIGFQPGDCATIVGKQGISISSAAIGTLFMGGKLAPIDPSMKPFEALHILKILDPKVIFCDAEVCDAMSRVVSNLERGITVVLLVSDPDEEYPFMRMEDFISGDVDVAAFRPVPSEDTSKSIAFLACSSGTTGLPKAVMLSDRSMVFQIMTLGNQGAKNHYKNISWLHVSHFFWVTGITFFLGCTCGLQKRIVVRDVLPQNILKAVDKYKPAITFLPPSHIDLVLSDPDFKKYDVSSIKLILAGGAALLKSTYNNVMNSWPTPVRVIQGYGCTEVGGMFSSMTEGDDVASIGRLIPGTKLKILKDDGELCGEGEVGELCLKSEAIMNGYAKNEEATKNAIDEDGWFHSGDTGYYKGEIIYIIGRIKELIKYKGMQIAPAELEDLIYSVPGVADVGVAGIKIDAYTNHPMALVVKQEGSEITEEDVVKCVIENLSDYKHLRGGVCFVDKIPRTTTGKIKRIALQTLADALYLGDSL